MQFFVSVAHYANAYRSGFIPSVQRLNVNVVERGAGVSWGGCTLSKDLNVAMPSQPPQPLCFLV